MKTLMKKCNMKLLLWSAVLMLSVGGNIFLSSPVVNAQTVYITRTGSKYHTHKCGNGTYFAASLSEAQSQGLTPCAKCFGSSSPSSSNNNRSSSKSSQSKSRALAKPIKINKTSLYLVKGQTSTLKIKNATKKVRWKSSKKSVASVSSIGKVTAKRKGKTTITASVGSQKKSCKVIVESPKLSSGSITLDAGKSFKLKLSGCSHSVSWSSSSASIAKVSAGNITAKKPGTATITAKVHKRKYKCKVKVNNLSADQLVLKQNHIKMGFDEEYELSISTIPKNLLDNLDYTVWSSNEDIVNAYASEDSDNIIFLESGAIAGSASVYISVGNITKECKVEVGPKTINSLSLSKTTINLKPDEEANLSLTINPNDATRDYDIVWKSSNNSVVTISQMYYPNTSVYLNAKGEGTADVTVTVGNKSATCHVVVAKPQINTLKLSNTNVNLPLNEKKTLSLSLDPSDADRYYNITWSSSDENVVSISYPYFSKKEVSLIAKNEGNADITVYVNNKSATCHVTVTKPQIKTLTLDKTEVTLKPDGNSSLSFDIDPYDASSYYEVSWTSSDENVVSVERRSSYSSFADISAVGEGEADVTVTIGDKFASCHVVVAKPQIETLTLDRTEITLKPDGNSSLSFDIDPYNADSYYEVIWTSSDENVVSVERRSSYSSFADVSAVGEGEADVTITIGDKSAICHIVVQK